VGEPSFYLKISEELPLKSKINIRGKFIYIQYALKALKAG
jgi:hypothetical protein